MKAIVQNDYGSPDVFELKEIDKPVVKDDDVLVRVHAAALHAGDYFAMRGVPYLVRMSAGWPKPKNYVPGYDVAGHVEAVGKNVEQLKPGDEVFGACTGTCAEYACAAEGISGYGVAIKLSRNNPMEDTFVRKIAEEMMLSIASKCIDSGARTIGHIKSHISTEAGTIKADTIGVSHGASSKGSLNHPVNDLYMAINSIVAGITEESVKDATLEGMHQLAEKDGLTVVKEKEHAYFDEFDLTILLKICIYKKLIIKDLKMHSKKSVKNIYLIKK